MNDVLHTIFTKMDFNNIKSIREVSKQFNELTKCQIKFNPLIQLIEQFPEENWDWDALTLNMSIPIEYVYHNPKMNRTLIYERADIINLTDKSDITIGDDIIAKFGTYDMVNKISSIGNYYKILYTNKNISFDNLINLFSGLYNYHLLYDLSLYNYMEKNKGMTRDFLLENINIFRQGDEIFTSPVLYIEDLHEYNYIAYAYLSKNPNINMEYVKNHLNENWDWTELTKNSAITANDIIENPTLPWDVSNIIENPNITINDLHQMYNMDILKENPTNYIFRCKNLDYENIIKLIEDSTIQNDFSALSFNTFDGCYQKNMK